MESTTTLDPPSIERKLKTLKKKRQELEEIEFDRKEEEAKLKERFEKKTATLGIRISSLECELEDYALSEIGEGKSKTFENGIIQVRKGKPSVVHATGKPNVSKIVSKLERYYPQALVNQAQIDKNGILTIFKSQDEGSMLLLKRCGISVEAIPKVIVKT